MIVKAERNAQVTPDSLKDRDAPARPAKGEDSELEMLKARIAVAKTLMPEPHAVHCRDCFQKGRDAVLRVLEGE